MSGTNYPTGTWITPRTGIDLPKGEWLTVRNVRKGATSEDVQAYFYEAGIDLSLDRISVAPQDSQTTLYANVVVSLNSLDILTLVERATHGLKLKGETLEFWIPRGRR